MNSLLRIINVITNVLVGVIVVFALLIVVGKPFGVHAYAVLSGSMEPEYHTGSLIYVKEVKPSTLGPGDVITFMTGKDTTVTHRIVDEVQGEDGVTRFQTQGDANSSPDGELVHPDNVIGTPVIQIPMLGYAVNFIQFPPGTYIAISVCAIAVFLMFLPDLFSKGDEDEDEDEDGEGERDKSPERGRGEPRHLPQGGVGPNPYPAHHAQRPQPQAAGARSVQGAEYGRPIYAQQPRGQQAARPVYEAGPQQARRQQALSAGQAQRTGAAGPVQAQQPRGQQGRSAQVRHHAAGQAAARPQQARPGQQQVVQQRMSRQAQPVQRAAAQPQQARSAQRQPQPSGQQRVHQQVRPVQQRAAQPQPAQPQLVQGQQVRPAQRLDTSGQIGANNPRLRNNQDVRSTKNAAQTNPQQAQPARRPAP